jgi:hypothetical protein
LKITIPFWIEKTPGVITRLGNVPAVRVDSLVELIEDVCKPVGRSLTVTIIAIDRKTFNQHLAPNGKAKAVSEFEQFPSASDLSLHLGYGCNEVAMKLGDSKRELVASEIKKNGVESTVRLRPQATLRGVTCQYEKDVAE